MYLKVHGRIYNLSAWSMISRAVEEGSYRASQGAADRGAVQITLPGISLPVAFSDTSATNPVSEEALVSLLHRAAGQDLGVFTWDEFEEAYRGELENLAHRRAIRELMEAPR